jgi:5'(3')-deoxyribonucleotidase
MKSFFYRNGYEDARSDLPMNGNNEEYIEGYSDYLSGNHNEYQESFISGPEPVQLSLFDFHTTNAPYRIFLDMDGVIVDMATTLCNEMRNMLKTQNKYSKKFWNKYPNFDLNNINETYLKEIFIAKDIGKELSKVEKNIKNLTYKPLSNNPDLWTNLPIYSGAKPFVEYLLDHWEVTILSSPVDLDSIIGKELWLNSHFPALLHNAIFETDKFLYAGPKNILIDDRPKNTKLWKEAGGISILHKNFTTTLEELQQYLN